MPLDQKRRADIWQEKAREYLCDLNAAEKVLARPIRFWNLLALHRAVREARLITARPYRRMGVTPPQGHPAWFGVYRCVETGKACDNTPWLRFKLRFWKPMADRWEWPHRVCRHYVQEP